MYQLSDISFHIFYLYFPAHIFSFARKNINLRDAKCAIIFTLFLINPNFHSLHVFVCCKIWAARTSPRKRENLMRTKREKKIKNLLISSSNNKTPFSMQSRLRRDGDYKNIKTLGFLRERRRHHEFCWSFSTI